MSTHIAHSQLVQTIVWIQQNLTPLELKYGRRRHLVFPCYDVAIEHMTAIDVLYRSELTGSMFALLRSLVESVVRGMWLDRCASEVELEQFRQNSLKKRFGELIREVESTFASDNRNLSVIHSRTWAALNGYTHTGYNQVIGRHGEGTLGAAYGESEIASALQMTSVFGLIAAGQLADAAGKSAVLNEAKAMLQRLENAA